MRYPSLTIIAAALIVGGSVLIGAGALATIGSGYESAGSLMILAGLLGGGFAVWKDRSD
ncbi:MAG: hypothetical protein KY469_04555 [Actinobacteria bacterium]|nr:hypothetical protein [Actinomycetota bacterium]